MLLYFELKLFNLPVYILFKNIFFENFQIWRLNFEKKLLYVFFKYIIVLFCRSSEGGSDAGGGIFLGPSSHYPPRRQHSQTHSEPDNSTDAASVHGKIRSI